MITLRQKILESTAALTVEKSRIKLYSGKLNLLKVFWKDFSILLKSFALSHANFGRQHLDEAELGEKFLKNASFPNDFTTILTSMLKFSLNIGEFFNSQSLELNNQQVIKLKTQILLIESLRSTFKIKTNQFLGTISKLSLQASTDMNKLEKTNREYEAMKNQIKALEVNRPVHNKTSESELKIVQEGLSMEASRTEETLLNILTEISHEQLSLNNLINKFENDLLLLQNQCNEMVETLIVSSISLSANLSQFKSDTSERMNAEILDISLDSFSQSVVSNTSSFSDYLSESDYKIDVIKYLKYYLKKIALFEDTFEKEYIKSKINPDLYQDLHLETRRNTLEILQAFEEIFIFHSNCSKALRQDIINPLNILIRVQSSLNSSVRISIKNISLGFKHGRGHSLSDSSIPGVVKISSKVPSLEKIKQKEISELIEDHRVKEESYLSSAKNIISMFHEITFNLYTDIQELYEKIIHLHNTLFEPCQKPIRAPLKAEFTEEKLRMDSLAILKSTSRNNSLLVGITFSSEDEELQRRFSLNEKESVISSFLCAYSDRILLQGKLYITRTSIYFYSYFNSSTFIFNNTQIRVRLLEVISIRKKANLYIFNNSIKLRTAARSYFFTSFLSRDEAFSILWRLLSLESKQASVPASPACTTEINIETRPFRLQIRSALLGVKAPQVNMLPSHYFTEEVFMPHVEFGIPAQQLFQLLFSDKNVGFLKNFLEYDGNKIIEISNWSAPAPDFYMGNPGDNWNYTAKRLVRSMHKLKEKLPLMSTHYELVENQSIYFVSEEEFVIEGELKIHAPYGDYFTTYMRWRVIGRENAVLSARYGMIFNRYTIFQGKIMREGIKETMETLRGTWLTLALKSVQESQGLVLPQVISPRIELQNDRESGGMWGLWGVILILLLIVVKLFQRISLLENHIFKLESQ